MGQQREAVAKEGKGGEGILRDEAQGGGARRLRRRQEVRGEEGDFSGGEKGE